MLQGSTLYTTCFPCPNCLKLAIAAGVVEVVYIEPYHLGEEDDVSLELAMDGGIELREYDGKTPWLRNHDE